VLETIMRSEDEQQSCCGCFESLGKDAEMALLNSITYERALLCDLLERPLGEIDLAESPVQSFQIVLVRLEGGLLNEQKTPSARLQRNTIVIAGIGQNMC
jgi:hypothetical protein